MKPIATVGLPFFNNAGTLVRAVQSVLAQSFSDWRLILIDDGSTDGSVNLLGAISDSRIELVSDGENLGLAVRLNQLAALADSPYLARMDADDMMHPQRLETQIRALKEDGRHALVCSDAIAIDADDEPGRYRRSAAHPSVRQILRHSPYIHPTVLGKTDWFRANPYDVSLVRCQDQELWARTAKQEPMLALAEPLLYLREAGTVPAAKYGSSMAGTRRVLRAHGVAQLGWAETQLRVVESYLKHGAYAVAHVLGQHDRIVRARGEALTVGQREAHREVIASIRNTVVKGLSM